MTELDRELPEGYKMTELGPLPREWEVVRLGDVAKMVRREVVLHKEMNILKERKAYLSELATSIMKIA